MSYTCIMVTYSYFVWFDSLRPSNNLSVIKGHVFLGWTSTKLGLMFFLKDTTQWCRWDSSPRPFGLESSTLLLSSYLLVLSADNLCKQFGSRSGPTKCWAWSGSKLFDTLIVFLKDFLKTLIFLKSLKTTKKQWKFPSMPRVKEITEVQISKNLSVNCEFLFIYQSKNMFWVLERTL